MSFGYELVEIGQKFALTVEESSQRIGRNYIMLTPGVNLLSEKYIVERQVREWEIGCEVKGIFFISIFYTNPEVNQMPKIDVVKVEVLEKGRILDLVLYVDSIIVDKNGTRRMQLNGYFLDGKFYDTNGNETETLLGTTEKIKLVRDPEKSVFTFFYDHNELIYESHTCLYRARNSFKIRCGAETSQLMRVGTIQLPTAINKSNLKVHITDDKKIIAYEYYGSYMQLFPPGNSPIVIKDVNLPVIVESVTLQIYKYKQDYIYMLIPPCCGKHNCLYYFNGKKIGCPSGGPDGRGDGTTFEGGTLLGTIQIPAK